MAEDPKPPAAAPPPAGSPAVAAQAPPEAAKGKEKSAAKKSKGFPISISKLSPQEKIIVAAAGIASALRKISTMSIVSGIS